ncbi:MAG TPA: hypothetical protein VFW44_05050 [Bryobacteraceae bacterium]|nr:hypothetical protein [Bryobacteraceae bacterium]
MIHHVQNSLLSEIGQRAMGQTKNPLDDRESTENFHGALTAAREYIAAGAAKGISAPPETTNPVATPPPTHPTSSLPIPPTPTASASTPSTTPASEAPVLDAQQAFDQSYWATQPAAIIALRNADPSERSTMAAQLASEGYKIDVPIMVWGWDPSIVTSMRQAEGYTWVPSALQSPVEMLPGLPSMGGLAAYNPGNPPANSILV